MDSNIIPSLKYAKTTMIHKWFVFRAGLRVGVSLWQLLVHDLSKFSLAELPHYGRRFYGAGDDPEGFGRAWIHHQNINPHHWEYWVPRTVHYAGGYKPNQPIEMPDKYAREMVADWMGASRAYEGNWPDNLDDWEWFAKNFDGIDIHPATRENILAIFDSVGLRIIYDEAYMHAMELTKEL